MLVALPVMMHPDPQKVAIIGLGSDDTVCAAAGRESTQSIACVEFLTTEYPLLEQYRVATEYGGLDRLSNDTRVDWSIGDGRVLVAQDIGGFDIIAADPLQPESAYVGSLYSAEYFALLKAHLKPSGFAITWTSTPRVLDTFTSVFEYAIHIGDLLVIGQRSAHSFRRGCDRGTV